MALPLGCAGLPPAGCQQGGAPRRIPLASTRHIELAPHAGERQQQQQQQCWSAARTTGRCAALHSGAPAAVEEVDVERVQSHAQASTSSGVPSLSSRHRQQQHQPEHLLALGPALRAAAGGDVSDASSVQQQEQLYVVEPWHSTNGSSHHSTAHPPRLSAVPPNTTAIHGARASASGTAPQPPSASSGQQGSSSTTSSTCQRPHESGVTPAKLAALSSALNLPVRQLQRHLLPKHPHLLSVPASELSHAHQTLRQGLRLPQRAARLVLTHHTRAAVRLSAQELQARASQLASLLAPGLTARHVLRAVGRGAPSLLIRQPSIVAARLKRLAAALGSSTTTTVTASTSSSSMQQGMGKAGGRRAGQAADSAQQGGSGALSMVAVLEIAGRAPELLTKQPQAVARRLEQCVAVLQGRWVPPATSPRGSSPAPPLPSAVVGAVQHQHDRQQEQWRRQSAGQSAPAGDAVGTGRQRGRQRGESPEPPPSAPAAAAAGAPHQPALSHGHQQQHQQHKQRQQHQQHQALPPRSSVLRALRRQPDLLLLSPRVLRNKLAALQCILDRPRRLVAPLLLACPALALRNLDAVRAAYEVLRPITGRDEGFAFGMVCHAPHLLLKHPQTLASQALHVRQAVRQVEAWRRELVRCSPAHAADLLGLSAPTYARLAYLVHTQQAQGVSLHAALSMPRCDFLTRYPGAATSPLMTVAVKKRPLARIPRWRKQPQPDASSTTSTSSHSAGSNGSKAQRRQSVAVAAARAAGAGEGRLVATDAATAEQHQQLRFGKQAAQEEAGRAQAAPIVLLPSGSELAVAQAEQQLELEHLQLPSQRAAAAQLQGVVPPGQEALEQKQRRSRRRHQQEQLGSGQAVTTSQGQQQGQGQEEASGALRHTAVQQQDVPVLVLHPPAVPATEQQFSANGAAHHALEERSPQPAVAFSNGHHHALRHSDDVALGSMGATLPLAAAAVVAQGSSGLGAQPLLHTPSNGMAWQAPHQKQQQQGSGLADDEEGVLVHCLELSPPQQPQQPRTRVQVMRLGAPAAPTGAPAQTSATVAVGAFNRQAQSGAAVTSASLRAGSLASRRRASDRRSG